MFHLDVYCNPEDMRSKTRRPKVAIEPGSLVTHNVMNGGNEAFHLRCDRDYQENAGGQSETAKVRPSIRLSN